jgi:hypothetical protein
MEDIARLQELLEVDHGWRDMNAWIALTWHNTGAL